MTPYRTAQPPAQRQKTSPVWCALIGHRFGPWATVEGRAGIYRACSCGVVQRIVSEPVWTTAVECECAVCAELHALHVCLPRRP